MTSIYSKILDTDGKSGNSRLTQLFLVIFGFLGFAVGFTLFFLSEQTDIFFAWPIKPPLSAAILGAGYLSSILMAPMTIREKYWSRSQISFLGFLPGLALIMLATFLHIDKFHFNNPEASPLAQLIAWLWVAGYIVITLVMLMMLYLQMRRPQLEKPPVSALPGWLRTLFWLVAISALVLCAILLVSPSSLAPFWPWQITPLVGRMLGAFLAAQGSSAVLALRGNDSYKVLVMCTGYILFVLLQVVAIIRYISQINLATPGGLVYLWLLGIIFATGLAGAVHARQVNKRSLASKDLEKGYQELVGITEAN